jgi:hypothetical protein
LPLTHPLCKRRKGHAKLPRRLLSLSRLKESNSQGIQLINTHEWILEYCALSYYWGTETENFGLTICKISSIVRKAEAIEFCHKQSILKGGNSNPQLSTMSTRNLFWTLHGLVRSCQTRFTREWVGDECLDPWIYPRYLAIYSPLPPRGLSPPPHSST